MDPHKDQQALIHLAWRRVHETRRLIFGWAELLPTCFPRMRGHPFRSLKGKKDASSLYVARFPMIATAAEAWFKAAAGGDLRLPGHPDKQTPGDGQPLEGPPFRQEPENGSQSSGLNLPFLPLVHGMMLAHGLFGNDDPVFSAELAKEPQAGWLRENMFIDLAEHPEYLGSVIMARHQPVVRDVDSRLGFNNGREVEQVRIRRWPGTGLAGHKLLAVEQRLLGLSIPKELSVDRPMIELDWNGKSNKTALVVMHPLTGVAWWREPVGFLRSLQVNLDLVSETRRIIQSVDPTGKVSQHFDVGWRSSANTSVISVIGDETDVQAPSNRAWRGEARRHQLRVAASLGLKWFDDAKAAQIAIREIIGKARNTFTVIDPYFGPEQIRDFAMAVTAGDVSIRIVTSEEYLRRDPDTGCESNSALMEKALSMFVSLGWAEPVVLVMRGRHAPLHDRFLIADGRVWLSGNSLNAIGRRASVLVELPNPQQVLNHLTPIIEKAEQFSVWFSRRGPTPDYERFVTWLECWENMFHGVF